ncbi:uncharacterized protein [Palaemon carinicauda]|uniref:uncharacterized protein n=2 Tax=Palaemon carinicauda TaxID=392227 RepID=UPI0035B5C7F6
MTLDTRISQVEKKAMDDGLAFMRQPSPETLHQYQLSRDDLVAPQQWGVLSPFLFNILLHRLLSFLPNTDNTTITCCADDICIHSTSPDHLQRFLSSFYESASSCDLIISPGKSRIFSPRPARNLPEFTVGNNVVPLCTQYIYLGAPVQIAPSIPVRQRVHPIVQDLLARLQRRLTPLKWLTNYSAGVSIPVARTIYIAFIRSVIDYLSPALCQLSRSTLQPLEKFQNQAMRFILGCPASTRIVNMQHELRLPPLVERIYPSVTYFSIKCLYYLHLSPHYSNIIRTSLDLDAPRPQLRQGGCTLVSTVCSSIRRLNINIVAENVDHGLAPWQTPVPAISYTPVSKIDLPQIQQKRALEAIDRLSSSLNVAHHLYTDGSLQQDGSAGCAVFSPTLEPPPEGWTGHRLPKSSSSTYCELNGLLDVIISITRTRNNGLIISNNTVDHLAKAACQLDPPDADAPTPSLLCCRKMVRHAARSPTSTILRNFTRYLLVPHMLSTHDTSESHISDIVLVP